MLRTMVVAYVAVLATGIAFAQDTKPKEQAGEQEIRKLLKDVEEGFSRGDAKALAACWTPSGDFLSHTGVRVEGRAAIEKGFEDFLSARKNGKLQFLVISLRVVNDGLALVDAIADMKPAGTSTAGEPSFNFVLVKTGGRWSIESARETIARVPAQAQHMKNLEWLVGDWVQESAPNSEIFLRSACGWTDNQAFLIRKFTVEGKGGVLHSGTEVIGWDPHTKSNRSWVFDSKGGYGENIWIQDGKRWLIKYSGTLSDGSDVSAANVITVVDPDTITLQSKGRTVNAVPQPDMPEITLKRQAAAKETPKPMTQPGEKIKETKKVQPRTLP